MKKIIIIVICVLLAAVIALVATLGGMGYYGYKAISETVTAPTPATDGSIVIMSANIRRQEKWWSTSKMDTGSRRWFKRAEYYLKNIAAVQPDLFGAQEVLPAQYEFLTEHLEGYGSVVTYRDDSGSRSESCPIFYSKERFEFIDTGTYWLSETPDEMSKSWGAKQYRITTYVRLKDKKTGLTIAAFNAHPEWDRAQGRQQELAVLAQKLQEVQADKTVLFGDLNTYKEEKDGVGIADLAPIDAILADSKEILGVTYGATFQNFGEYDENDPPACLDYIYVPYGTEVLEAKKLDTVYDGVYPSDHFPIYAKVKF